MLAFWQKRVYRGGELQPPQGQSLLELMLLLSIMSALLMMLVVIGNIGIAGLKTSQAARFSAFDCDNRPGFCRALSSTPVQKIRSAVFYSDEKEVFPFDSPNWKSVDSLGAQRIVMHRPEDISLSLDLPRVDGADKGLLSKLSDLFRGLSMKAGPAIFGLPTPDHLARSTVSAVLWDMPIQSADRLVPRLTVSSRVALISDSWAAAGQADFFKRVRDGETPSALAVQAIEGLYIPGKDFLMPVLSGVGLERSTAEFRSRFHSVDHEIAYPGTRVLAR
jgi:hypothetical protein